MHTLNSFHLLPELSLNGFEVAQFVEKSTASGKTKLHLYKDGHVFYLMNGKKAKRSYWLCKEYWNRNGGKCTAKATTQENHIIRLSGHHNHDVIELLADKQQK